MIGIDRRGIKAHLKVKRGNLILITVFSFKDVCDVRSKSGRHDKVASNVGSLIIWKRKEGAYYVHWTETFPDISVFTRTINQ